MREEEEEDMSVITEERWRERQVELEQNIRKKIRIFNSYLRQWKASFDGGVTH
jgi:hypothetical protein